MITLYVVRIETPKGHRRVAAPTLEYDAVLACLKLERMGYRAWYDPMPLW